MSNEGIQKQLFYVSIAYNICVLYLFIILWDTIQDKIKHLILSQYLDNVSISISNTKNIYKNYSGSYDYF